MTRQFSLLMLICLVMASFFVTKFAEPPILEPQYRSLSLKITEIKRNNNLTTIYAKGYIIKTFDLDPRIKPGDTIGFTGKISDVRDSSQKFYSESYSKYLLSQKIYYQAEGRGLGLVKKANNIYTVRHYIREGLSNTLDSMYGRNSAMIKALVYGDKSGMSKEENRLFSITGTSHVLALSGFHVGIVGLMLNVIFGKLPVKKRGLLTIAILISYAFVTGLRASILRATGFFVLYYIAFIKRERYNLFAASAIMASLLLAINPYYIYDMGFVLSFAGVVSIACFYPLLKSLISGYSFSKNAVVKMALVTIAAQGFTLPLCAYYFGIISIVSILSNLVIVPLISALMPLAIISVAVHALAGHIPLLYAFDMGLRGLVELVGDMVMKSAELFAKMPKAFIETQVSESQLIESLTLLIIGYLLWEIKTIRENKYESEGSRKIIT